MSVPDEAVEAACTSFFRGLNHIHPESKADMRAALEAAAPYMLAAAHADMAAVNRAHLEKFRYWVPGDPIE